MDGSPHITIVLNANVGRLVPTYRLKSLLCGELSIHMGGMQSINTLDPC